MEHYYNKFVKTLQDFIKDLNRYVPNAGCTKFLECFDKLDMHKVILRYVGIMREHETNLKNCDESVFVNPLFVFPGINLSELMSKVPQEKKKKIFIYLHTLLVISDMMVQSANESEVTPVDVVPSQNPTNNDTFNPYIGVGVNDGEALSCSQMYSAKYPEEPQQQKPGIGSIVSSMGIDKMLNLKQLTEQLKNMTKEDIDEATESIRNLLGKDANDKTTILINDMLHNINDELKNDSIGTENPLDNIVKIAESVASKMKPKMENDGVDISQLWNSTQNLAERCKDANGNTMFPNGMNPFDMVNKMLSGKMGPNGPRPNDIQDMLNNIPLPSDMPIPPGMTKEQYLAQYSRMMMNQRIGGKKPKK